MCECDWRQKGRLILSPSWCAAGLPPRLGKQDAKGDVPIQGRELMSDKQRDRLVKPKAVGCKSVQAKVSGQHEYQHQADRTVDLW